MKSAVVSERRGRRKVERAFGWCDRCGDATMLAPLAADVWVCDDCTQRVLCDDCLQRVRALKGAE